MSDFLVFDGISKHYGDIRAVDNVSLSIRKGEVFSLLGPSGCGKTTLLRCCAGFEEPTTGRILLDGQDITRIPPHQRKVNTIFQSYALFPHLTIRENIAFGPRTAKWPRAEIDREVDRMLALIQMEGYADRQVTEISGGQKQRVAIARALINRPQVLLLDEPLAALDLKLRQRMLLELDLIHDEVGITFIYVTHDQGEAMAISDRIAAMNRGRVEQVGTPAQVYETPASSFVAAFIGDTNFFDGKVVELVSGEHCRIVIDGLPDAICFNDERKQVGDLVHLIVRPEKFHIAAEPPEANPRHNVLEARVEDVVYMGGHTKFWVRAGDYRLSLFQQHTRFLLDQKPIRWGDTVWVWWHSDDGNMLQRYSEKDENLVELPPEAVGDTATGGTSPGLRSRA